MKVARTISKLLENKYVLYVVLFLAITNLLGYMMMGNVNALVFFILVAFLTSNFSKNMIVVLLTPLVLTSLLMVGAKVKEGLESMGKMTVPEAEAAKKKVDEAPTSTQEEKDKAAKDLLDAKAEETKKAGASEATPAAPPTPEASVAALSNSIAGGAAAEQAKGAIDASPSTGTVDKPASAMTTMYKKGNRIDYASTVEDAYGDLNKILGGDGIKNLTSDTQRLMDQQMQLAEAMKGMSPLLDQAKSMLQGFDMKNLDSLAGMAKSFGAPVAK